VRGIRLEGRGSTKVSDLSRSGDVLRPDPVEGLDTAHDSRSLATHSQANSRNPTRSDTSNRHLAANNSRTAGRSATPPRGVPAIPASRAAAAEITELLPIPSAREETVELRAVPNPAVPNLAVPNQAVPPTATPPAQAWPSRPAPDDAAAEVWALVERAQAGDADAFGLIYDRYVDTVFRFIYFRVGNRPLAEDLTADTFLRALKRIGSFTWQGRDLGAWLVTIARNLVADHFKSGRYRLEVTTGDVLDADREDRGPEGSPEIAVVDHITNVALLTAVRQLNPEQQECIVLRFLHGFSVAETAQAMQKNEGAIKALQYRAVRALHRLLPEGFQP
jgi:RNA polymerase sigma-70 factor, ECF subfamily